MIAVILLVVVGGFTAVAAVRLLPRAPWTRRAPGIGVVLWQSISVTVVACVLLSGLALALPVLPAVSTDLADILGACEFLVRDHYQTPGGYAAGIFGLAIFVLVVLRIGWVLGRELFRVSRVRARYRDRLSLVARGDLVDGVWVVTDTRPAIFCIPGSRPRTVLTTGALAALSERQRDLALAHEQAHLLSRHHLVLTMASVLRVAFPRISLFEVAERETETLVEMHADDRAARDHDRAELAAAVVRLATGTSPAGGLAANGGAALQRVQRLLASQAPMRVGMRNAIRGGTALLVTLPALMALSPALESAWLDYCAHVL